MEINKLARALNVLSVGRDAKTIKNQKYGYLTGILYLAPHTISGVANVCSHASDGCKEACLFSSGKGAFSNVIQARINKTIRFFKDQAKFIEEIKEDIDLIDFYAKRLKMKPSIRLNGTSDLDWTKFDIFTSFPNVEHYDYTKVTNRMKPDSRANSFENYHLTFSRSENNQKDVEKVIGWGGNVAVVFSPDLPEKYLGKKVVNGDLSDCRNLDGKGVIVGLKAKGRARKDKSGFVVAV